jgi:hypothetical protein
MWFKIPSLSPLPFNLHSSWDTSQDPSLSSTYTSIQVSEAYVYCYWPYKYLYGVTVVFLRSGVSQLIEFFKINALRLSKSCRIRVLRYLLIWSKSSHHFRLHLLWPYSPNRKVNIVMGYDQKIGIRFIGREGFILFRTGSIPPLMFTLPNW